MPIERKRGLVTRITIDLTASEREQLSNLEAITQASAADVVRRALDLYAYVAVTVSSGGELHVRRGADDERLVLLGLGLPRPTAPGAP